MPSTGNLALIALPAMAREVTMPQSEEKIGGNYPILEKLGNLPKIHQKKLF